MKEKVINSKLEFQTESHSISRTEAKKKINNMIQKSSAIYICGGQAIGKTEIIKQIAEDFQGHYAVCNWSAQDNEYKQFQKYLCAMFHSWLKGGNSEDISEMILTLQEVSEPILIIWENVDVLKSEKILESIGYLLKYLPNNYRILMSGCNKLPESLYPILWQGRLVEVNAELLFFDEKEIQEYFAQEGHGITRMQAREVKQLTEGWPGLVKICADSLQGRQNFLGIVEFLGESYFGEFIRVNLWDSMTEQEKDICKIGTYFGGVSESMLKQGGSFEVMHELLWGLYRKQILCAEESLGEKKQYRVCGPVKYYIQENFKNQEEEFLEKYGESMGNYFINGNCMGDAVKVFARLKDKKKLLYVLQKYYRTLPFTMEAVELSAEIRRLSKEQIDNPEIQYLKGMCGNILLEEKDVDEARTQLQQYWKKEEDCKRKKKIGEMLLNLLYADVRLPMEKFLEEGGRIVKEIEACTLFSFQGNHCTPLYGLRDFSGILEMEPIRQEQMKHRWMELWEPVSGEWWDVALEAGKMMIAPRKKGESDIAKFEIEMKHKQDEGKGSLLMLLGFVYDCERDMKEADGMNNYIAILEEKAFRELDSRMIQTLQAQQAVHFAWENEKGRMAQWLRMTEMLDYESITLENFYPKMVRAHGYLMFAQYQKAVHCLESLSSFFRQCGWFLAASQCAFPQAVALYELGDKKEALKKTMESFIWAGRYRDYFLYYGKTGKKLLLMYQEQYLGVRETGGQKKKKTYIGANPQNSSMEGYIESLIQEAETRYLNSPYTIGTESIKSNKLTMTEIMVLQLISEGKSNQEIADSMKIKISTVKSHAYSLFQKLGVKTRARAVAVGKNEGYIN